MVQQSFKIVQYLSNESYNNRLAIVQQSCKNRLTIV